MQKYRHTCDRIGYLMNGWWRVMDVLWLGGANQQCMSSTFSYLRSHLRKDEEEGGRADQEAGGRAHRDEGAGLQWVGAAGGHPVLSALIRVSSLTKATANTPREYPFVCVSLRMKPFINLRAAQNENHSQRGETEEPAAAALLSPASRPVCPSEQRRTEAASGSP